MNLAKIFKFGKKGAKKIPRGKKKGEKAPTFPSGTRVGVYGHVNSGKTCYFTVLNESCKTDRRLQISVSDHSTAAEFLQHFREIWGLSTTVDTGTAIDLAGEKKFPEPTEQEKVIQFTAMLDRGKKLNVVSYDYPGQAIDITEASDTRDNVVDFMLGADGLMFFYDPKLLQAELQNQAHVASFVYMIEQIAPLNARLPIPVALVVTKADILPGFTGEDQTVLIANEDEALLAEDFDVFLARVLDTNRVKANSAWAGTVREVLLKLRDFLRVVVGRTLDFQIFFTTNTGEQPQKIGTDVGRSIYAPPKKLIPAGVREPMYWLLNSIVRNRSVSRFRAIARWAATLAIIWILVFSAPFAYHFWYVLPQAERTERNILKGANGSVMNTNPEERGRISRAWYNYEFNWSTKLLFPSFQPVAGRIKQVYDKFDMADAAKQLDQTIQQFATIVKDTTNWPHVNPTDSAVILTEKQQQMLDELNRFHQGDEQSPMVARSGRALNYWDLFTKAIQTPDDTTYWNIIKRQVQQDQSLYAKDITPAEQALGKALQEREVKKVQKVIAKQASFEFSDAIIDKINNDPDPAYRLGTAVKELRSLKQKLDPNDVKHRRMIDNYLDEVKSWTRFRDYKGKVETLPGNAHIHIEVTDPGQDPAWTDLNQIFAGDAITIRWKEGQDIHVAIDTLGHPEGWGKNPSDKVVFKGKYALFDLEKGISFDNIGKKVSIRFEPSLTDRLPVLK